MPDNINTIPLESDTRRLKQLFDLMEDGVCIINSSYDIEYINPALEKDFGPVHARKCYFYFHDLKDVCPWCKNEEVFKGNQIRWEGYSSKSKKHYEVFDCPLKNDDGTISKFEILHDITDQLETKEKLKKNEAMLRQVLETLPVGVWILDETGKIIHGNPESQKIWGGAKYVGISQYGEYRGWWLQNGKKIEPQEWAAARAISKGEISLNEEIEIECFDKSHKIILNSAVPMKNKEGRITGVIVLNQDITINKQMEQIHTATFQILQESQKGMALNRILERVLEIISKFHWPEFLDKGSIFLADKARKILFLEAARGLSQEELKICREIPFEYCLCGQTQVSQRLIFLNKCTENDLKHHRLNGPHGHYGVPITSKEETLGVICLYTKPNAYKVRGREKVLTSIAEVVAEVVERKKSQEERTLFESTFKNLMELLPVGIAISTPEGIIVDVNPTLLKMTGYDSKDEFLKIPVLAHYVSPADRRQLISQLKQSASAKIELPLKRKDGSSFFAFVTSTIVSDISEKKFIISTIQDITREKEAEKRIQQAQKMEAIGTLAGGIAHDFNNILSAVLGYTELSLLELPKDSKILENLSNVKNGALRARDLVKQILDFSRESKSEKIPANLGPIIKEAIKLIRASLPSTIEIRYFINKDAGIVNINPTQIHQVLMNLCTNAAHAMRVNGGILEIRLTREKIDSSNNIEDPELMEGNYVKLTVSDTGHGIPADIINHIFDPYFTTKERGEGTGLGLSVVHGIVKSHGGAVIAKSEYGKGASFHIFLPCSAVEKEGKELPSKSLTPIPGKGKILFLDDEEVLVHLGQKMLERLGYDVVIRTSSLEALELFKSNPDSFDFVITDLTMPNMTGDRLAKEILEIRPDIPVILCTGFSERISSEIAKAIGIKEFIFKPFTTGDLSTVLNRITRERDETKIPPSPQS